jgi:hypothetical protein
MADEFCPTPPGTVGITSHAVAMVARVFHETFPHSPDLPGAAVADGCWAQDTSTGNRTGFGRWFAGIPVVPFCSRRIRVVLCRLVSGWTFFGLDLASVIFLPGV